MNCVIESSVFRGRCTNFVSHMKIAPQGRPPTTIGTPSADIKPSGAASGRSFIHSSTARVSKLIGRPADRKLLERPTQRQALADQVVRDRPARADSDQREHVAGLAAEHARQVVADELADLVGDGREDLVRSAARGHERRHPPQRLLFVRQPRRAGSRFGVRDGRRDQLGEVAQASFRTGGQRAASRRRDHHAPESVVDDDRRADDGLQCACRERTPRVPRRRRSRRCGRRDPCAGPRLPRSGGRAERGRRPAARSPASSTRPRGRVAHRRRSGRCGRRRRRAARPPRRRRRRTARRPARSARRGWPRAAAPPARRRSPPAHARPPSRGGRPAPPARRAGPPPRG